MNNEPLILRNLSAQTRTWQGRRKDDLRFTPRRDGADLVLDATSIHDGPLVITLKQAMHVPQGFYEELSEEEIALTCWWVDEQEQAKLDAGEPFVTYFSEWDALGGRRSCSFLCQGATIERVEVADDGAWHCPSCGVGGSFRLQGFAWQEVRVAPDGQLEVASPLLWSGAHRFDADGVQNDGSADLWCNACGQRVAGIGAFRSVPPIRGEEPFLGKRRLGS